MEVIGFSIRIDSYRAVKTLCFSIYRVQDEVLVWGWVLSMAMYLLFLFPRHGSEGSK
jgi:hypothetical protein